MILGSFLIGFFGSVGVLTGITVYSLLILPLMAKVGIISVKRKPAVQKQATVKKGK